MKKIMIALCVMLMLPLGMAGGVRNEASIRVIVNRPVGGGHDHLAEPVAYYDVILKLLPGGEVTLSNNGTIIHSKSNPFTIPKGAFFNHNSGVIR